MFLEELPAVNITFGEEENKVIDGSEFFPKWYECTSSIIATVVCDDIINASDGINESEKGADYIDYLAEQVEQTIGDDWYLSRRHPDYDEDRPEQTALTDGHRITGSSLYEVEVDSERRLLAIDIRIQFRYEKKARPTRRLRDFQTYLADIVRVGATDETVDPVLMSADGDVQ